MSYYGHRDPLEFFFAEEFDASRRVVQAALDDPAPTHELVFNMTTVETVSYTHLTLPTKA